jgi:hypothetical protein
MLLDLSGVKAELLVFAHYRETTLKEIKHEANVILWFTNEKSQSNPTSDKLY